MTIFRVAAALFALLVLGVIVEMLRRRQLREKYAVLWLCTGLAMVPLAVVPGMLDKVATSVGIANGANLVLFLAIVFLLFVCMHLSWEVSRLEEETRVLAEDIALLRMEREQEGER